jgi:hypothetical protein
MSKVQIFVEGIADQKFLQDLIEEWYGVKLTIGNLSKTGNILETQGKDVFKTEDKLKKLTQIFELNRLSGVQNLVIFDADTYAETHTYISKINEAQNFDFFLFPNNESDGDLEALLENIIHPDNRAIFDCWRNYEECLAPNFTTPARKTKIYAYLEAILGESKSQKEQIKEMKRDYRNTAHWVLDSEQMTILQPLKSFLDAYFL